MSRKSKRLQKDYYYSDPWWRREYGGMPVWAIMVALAAICAVPIYAMILQF